MAVNVRKISVNKKGAVVSVVSPPKAKRLSNGLSKEAVVNSARKKQVLARKVTEESNAKKAGGKSVEKSGKKREPTKEAVRSSGRKREAPVSGSESRDGNL